MQDSARAQYMYEVINVSHIVTVFEIFTLQVAMRAQTGSSSYSKL